MELTVDQWLSVANTGVLLVTALIVGWYTVETYWLRQLSQKQVDLLMEQNARERERFDRQQDPELELFSVGDSPSGERQQVTLLNKGAVLRAPRLSSGNTGRFPIRVEPHREVVGPGDFFSFTPDVPAKASIAPFELRLEFYNAADRHRKKSYLVDLAGLSRGDVLQEV